MTIWRYETGAGVIVEGTFQRSVDHGGTDVTYIMRRADGTVDVLSGSRLKQAKVIRREGTARKPANLSAVDAHVVRVVPLGVIRG